MGIVVTLDVNVKVTGDNKGKEEGGDNTECFRELFEILRDLAKILAGFLPDLTKILARLTAIKRLVLDPPFLLKRHNPRHPYQISPGIC